MYISAKFMSQSNVLKILIISYTSTYPFYTYMLLNAYHY